MRPLRHEVVKVLPYTPEQLFALVGDVKRYPEFVPWLIGLRTWNEREASPGVQQLDAEATVGFKLFKERFSTRVRRDAEQRRIDVTLLSGPFHKLANRWTFHPDPGGTRVEFHIEFAFKSRILEALLAANFAHAVERLIGCFEARAQALYGAQPPAVGARQA
ncbi:MAG: type II toxin-antitoxin system RatA family toxin [Phenylobacterium sp.]